MKQNDIRLNLQFPQPGDSLVQPLSMPEEVLTFSFSDVHAVPEGAVTYR